MKVSMDKKYRTRDGREVRLLMTDGGGSHPVLGAVLLDADGTWEPEGWTADGRCYFARAADSTSDLIEVTPEHTRWLVMSPESGYASRQEAVEMAARYAPLPGSAVVKVTFREGEIAAE